MDAWRIDEKWQKQQGYVRVLEKAIMEQDTIQYYAIQDKKEAESYLQHPILSKRLMEITDALLKLDSNNANEIFGDPDDMKLKSSMILFSFVSEQAIFEKVLDKFFDGKNDEKTIELLVKGEF